MMSGARITTDADKEDLAWLNPRMRAFAEHLAADKEFNLTRAAEKAGYARPNNSGPKLLQNPHIRAYLGRLIHERAEELKIDAQKVLRELAYIGFFRAGELFREDGTLRHVKDCPEAIQAAVKEFEVRTTTISAPGDNGDDADGEGQREKTITVEFVKVRVWDKEEALRQIAEHLGILRGIVNINFTQINWAELFSIQQGLLPGEGADGICPACGRPVEKVIQPVDAVEEKIAKAARGAGSADPTKGEH